MEFQLNKIEDRIYALWLNLRRLLTTDDDVLLGTCASLSRKTNIPVVAIRLVALVSAGFWPIITLIVYVVANLLIYDSDES